MTKEDCKYCDHPGVPNCGDRSHSFSCSRESGHSGAHLACGGSAGHVLAAWIDDGYCESGTVLSPDAFVEMVEKREACEAFDVSAKDLMKKLKDRRLEDEVAKAVADELKKERIDKEEEKAMEGLSLMDVRLMRLAALDALEDADTFDVFAERNDLTDEACGGLRKRLRLASMEDIRMAVGDSESVRMAQQLLERWLGNEQLDRFLSDLHRASLLLCGKTGTSPVEGLTLEEFREIEKLLAEEHGIIPPIKYLRTVRSVAKCGLKEAKDLVEKVVEFLKKPEPR